MNAAQAVAAADG